MHSFLLVLATFLASGVEMVEALTIVLAVGVTRGWRSTLVGVAAATVSLAMIVALLGPALTRIPIDALRLVVGALLLTATVQSSQTMNAYQNRKNPITTDPIQLPPVRAVAGVAEARWRCCWRAETRATR